MKYLAIFQVNLRSQFAYLGQVLLGATFLAVIQFIFFHLWQATFRAAGSARIAGFSFREMVWYLVFTETLVAFPRIRQRVDEEVRSGDIAYVLGRPYHYLGYHLATFLAEGALRQGAALLVGGAVIWALAGAPPVALQALLPGILVWLLALAGNFCLQMAIALSAFWTEDTFGIFRLVTTAQMLLGGMLLPLDLFPAPIAAVARALSFGDLVYAPARLAVKFTWDGFWSVLLRQSLWVAALALLVLFLYSRGVRRVAAQGG